MDAHIQEIMRRSIVGIGLHTIFALSLSLSCVIRIPPLLNTALQAAATTLARTCCHVLVAAHVRPFKRPLRQGPLGYHITAGLVRGVSAMCYHQPAHVDLVTQAVLDTPRILKERNTMVFALKDECRAKVLTVAPLCTSPLRLAWPRKMRFGHQTLMFPHARAGRLDLCEPSTLSDWIDSLSGDVSLLPSTRTHRVQASSLSLESSMPQPVFSSRYNM